MIPQNFAIALRGFQRRKPFLPFLIELLTVERLRVQHPEAVALRGQVAVFVAPDAAVKLFDGASVCQLLDESAPPSS